MINTSASPWKIHIAMMLACLCGICKFASGSEIFTIEPTEDAFVRAAKPTLNYGAAGALAVAGVDAKNGTGQMQGRFDSVIKFNTSDAVGHFNTVYGVGNWDITSVALELSEVAAPNNPTFNRGVGDFEAFWLSDDNWVEGPGKPSNPPDGHDIEMTYNLLQSISGSATERSLGIMANDGTDSRHNYILSLDQDLVDDLVAGGDASFHLAPVTSTIGFTFYSVDNTTPATHPALIIAAVPEPTMMILLAVGCLMAGRRITRRGRGAG